MWLFLSRIGVRDWCSVCIIDICLDVMQDTGKSTLAPFPIQAATIISSQLFKNNYLRAIGLNDNKLPPNCKRKQVKE